MKTSLTNGHPFLNNLSLVMYDLDGTLVESVPDLAAALDKMLLDLGMPAAGESKTRLWVGNGIPSLVKRALADDLRGDLPGQVDSSLFQTAHELFKSHYNEELGHHSYLYPGVSDFLGTMKDRGIKQVVITNKSEQFTDRLLQLMGIDHCFELTIGGDSLTEKKTHPMPLLYAMQRFDIPSEQSLMIGDSVNDIRAARAAGVRVVGLPYGYNHGEPIEQAKPDLVVASLTTLL
ncbi:phosphoglycolate phosphatase [Endozoicomonas sp. SCSIO W0465]|uniref:phosphoglycolate phosphatase n=1 Tax=Endozoicomonas sp. SCSIO W0465 TaxID=2918516 RepID=UPI002075BD66|nr:phosphoglycolate phosphatase [Endozoicomonas sp. SCSIO W0465]USE35611.1 phosphoglycolate phosphatase [Endozoicomonas sp. SCSIO W0465]